MKPEKLAICGWGPYKDRVEIDFDRFCGQGLFLVTGATGAGKTTIFEAISYALFGELGGSMRSKDSVRSDFAYADTRTYVELCMSHDGKTYLITRNPQYFRPKKRKGGKSEYTKESENAVLQLPDGRVLEGNKEVNRMVQEILKMDFDQFRQISMIAQGEFTKLLTASSKEKTQIFRDIFGTHIYERFAAVLHQRAGKLYARIMAYRNKMDETVEALALKEEEWIALTENKEYSYQRIKEYLETQLGLKKHACIEAAEELIKAEKMVAAQEKKIQEAKRTEQLFKELAEAEAKKSELAAQKDSIMQTKNTVLLAGNAEKAELAAMQKQGSVQRLEETNRKIRGLEDDCKALEEKRNAGEAQYSNREDVKEVLDTLLELVEARKVCAGKEKIIQADRTLLQRNQKEYLKLEQKAQQEKSAYEHAWLLYRRAMVGIVAMQVKEGEPCPVCGSLQHPDIAGITAEVPSEDVLKCLKQIAEDSTQELLSLHGKTSSLKGEVETKEADLSGIYAQILIKEKTITKTSDIIKMLVTELSTINFHEIIGAEGGDGKTDASICLKKALSDQAENSTKIQQIEADLIANKAFLRILEKDKITQSEEAKRAQSAYYQKLLECNFKTEEQYLAVKLNADEIGCMQQEIESYEQQAVSNADHIKRIQAAVKGKRPPVLEELSRLKKEAEDAKKEIQKEYNFIQILCAQIEKAFLSLRGKMKEVTELEQEYGIVKDLDNITAGNNPKRLVFEQYVLANYFDQVLTAANMRLYRMTSGRYELSRAEGASDGRTKDNFEIQVLDNYTGKYRLAKTLSGGEAFKASLSLALGMSDIIQADSGGVKVETLFIDEGFGSLDAESLDQACGTLTSLVEKNRFIGIISHVPELRERIDKQLVVEKTNVGSHIKMIV